MPPVMSQICAGRFRFERATSADESMLRKFARRMEMPGAIRFVFEREPDYFQALCVEGRETRVLVCRDLVTGCVVATGHRSFKPMYINGELSSAGYLSGLRLEQSVRNRRILARGYAFLRDCHQDGEAPFYLTTIMEDNHRAKAILLSDRAGLPRYHDFGKFCCMALGLRRQFRRSAGADIRVRCARAADGPAIVDFLRREGRSRQFFPEYRMEDVGVPGGLLSHLAWEDIFLAFRGSEMLGMAAAWDQRPIRQWRVTGYNAWLRRLRIPLNLAASLKGFPALPPSGATLNYFILSLVCIRHQDQRIFSALLDGVVCERRRRYAFFLAGLHERDPLLPELLARPHLALPSRLYVVAWPDGEDAVRKLDRRLVPYLEPGSL